MSARPPLTLRTVIVAVSVLLAAVLVASMSQAPAGAAGAGPAAARASGPTYGPYSTYYGDLRARIATPTRKRPHLRAQVQRRSSVGERQVRLTWRPAGQQTRSSRLRRVASGESIEMATSVLPCGRTRVTLHGRSRPRGGTTWGTWKAFSADISRIC
jgi:hypothetical protein